MSAIAQQESLVKESLFQFITKNVPSADLNVIDDIVLSYVISILEEASQDPCFDVEGFIEMMAAYVPEFSNIDAGAVCTWVLQLEAELTAPRRLDDIEATHDNFEDDDKISLTLQSLSEMLPSITKSSRSRSNSTNECLETEEPERRNVARYDGEEYSDQCQILHEMFPNSSAMEIKHCITIALGEIERAAATLLLRREGGQALPPAPPSQPPRHHAACDSRELKNRIIARYSYVDKNSETKEHKPLAPKIEPKKMVRYRDNKIVSLKGERYTEVPKSGIDEEHLKKPKRQHCP